ncbi:hypothetical protein [Marinicrinis sediminis]|uniref:DNA binding HTH domain-containing protein n=1 Tax=Marinicrinis sediminis TaxID=1652465 RepID=A0ABW5RDL3_9BACL
MKTFLEAIRQYQLNKDPIVFDMIRNAMGYDFLKHGLHNLPGPEYYVAFRCLRLIGGRLSTIKYTLSEAGLDIKRDSPDWIFAEHAAQLEAWTGIKLTVENYREHELYLARYFSASFPILQRAYEQLTGQRETLWSLLTSRLVEEHWDDLFSAIEYALTKVDTELSERQIVHFVNRAIRTHYVKTQFADKRRVRREGKVKYVDPKYYGPIYTLFGADRIDLIKQSQRNQQFIDRIVSIIEEDKKTGDFSEYHVDLTGGYRMKNRYIAKKLGIHEASLSRRLRKIKE